MNKDEPLVIKKVGNGYVVESIGDPRCTTADSGTMVFQSMKSVYGGQDVGDTLLGFIERHFTSGQE